MSRRLSAPGHQQIQSFPDMKCLPIHDRAFLGSLSLYEMFSYGKNIKLIVTRKTAMSAMNQLICGLFYQLIGIEMCHFIIISAVSFVAHYSIKLLFKV